MGKCSCRDPSKQKGKCPKTNKCGAPKFHGDGRCDDENNNCSCNWDNGDCCGKNSDKLQFAYCKACKCSDPLKTQKCDGHCGSPNYKGDGAWTTTTTIVVADTTVVTAVVKQPTSTNSAIA